MQTRLLALGPALCALLAIGASPARAETGYDAWLRYSPVPDSARAQYASMPRTVVTLGNSLVLTSARDEIVRGLGSMLGGRVATATALGSAPAIVLGTIDDVRRALPDLRAPAGLGREGFWLGTSPDGQPVEGGHSRDTRRDDSGIRGERIAAEARSRGGISGGRA